jgi:hypothetical protein
MRVKASGAAGLRLWGGACSGLHPLARARAQVHVVPQGEGPARDAIDIHCGEGNQILAWLAHAACARLAHRRGERAPRFDEAGKAASRLEVWAATGSAIERQQRVGNARGGRLTHAPPPRPRHPRRRAARPHRRGARPVRPPGRAGPRRPRAGRRPRAARGGARRGRADSRVRPWADGVPVQARAGTEPAPRRETRTRPRPRRRRGPRRARQRTR